MSVHIGQTVHLKYVQFILCQLYLNKVVFKRDLNLKRHGRNVSAQSKVEEADLKRLHSTGRSGKGRARDAVQTSAVAQGRGEGGVNWQSAEDFEGNETATLGTSHTFGQTR